MTASEPEAAQTEAALYPPVKALLEAQGYAVKGEVGAADIVACRAGEPPVIVELKRGFALSLFHQAIDRLRLSDAVYIAVPEGRGARWQGALKANTALCRRLGLGLILVHRGQATVALDPGPYAPRPAKRRRAHLLREFARREGDPTAGGLPSAAGRVTAYRQDALRIASYLDVAGAARGVEIARATGVTRATRMMADNHYGWFERVEKGVYRLTPRGCDATAKAQARGQAPSQARGQGRGQAPGKDTASAPSKT
ncbi:MAG: DUF2161 family putative PD-(D/E)XK-type phosphodiesterase [Pseudomonadota bacterium]